MRAALAAAALALLSSGAEAAQSFTGTVTAEDGTPLSGVTVDVLNPGGESVTASAVTNALGVYTVSPAVGTYHLRAQPNNYFPSLRPSYPLSAGGSVTVNFALQASGEGWRDDFSAGGTPPSGWTASYGATTFASSGNIMLFRTDVFGGVGVYQGVTKSIGSTLSNVTYPYTTIRSSYSLSAGAFGSIQFIFDHSGGWSQRVSLVDDPSQPAAWKDRTYPTLSSIDTAFLLQGDGPASQQNTVDHYYDHIIIHSRDRGYLRGKVRDKLGAGMGGERVEVLRGTYTVGEVLSDASGAYEVWVATEPSAYTLRVRKDGFVTWLTHGLAVAGRTQTAADAVLAAPPSGAEFTSASSVSVSMAWSLSSPTLHVPVVLLSTAADFSVLTASGTGALGQQTTTWAVPFDNATYYFKVKVLSDPDSNFSAAVSTVNPAATPTALYFEAISSHSVTASAYAPGPAFSSMTAGMSGANVALGAAYAGWGAAGWSSFATPGPARFAAAGAALDGRFYIMGGNAGADLKTVDVYDPVVNAWFSRADLLSARNGLGAAAAGGRLYAVAGYSGGSVASVESYDPTANQWTARAPLPVAAHNQAVAAAAGKVYAMGGDPPTANNYEFDPDSNTWTARSPLPSARGGAAAAVLDGKIYLTAGFTSGFSDSKRLDRFDPAANAWTALADLPSARNSHGSAALGGKVWVLGGMDPSYLSTVVRYDPAANMWTNEPRMPTARRSMAVAAVGGRIYAVTGFDGGSLSTSERYDAGVTSSFTALAPNTLYSFKAKARNSVGAETAESPVVSTYTLAAATTPQAGTPLFGAVYAASVTVNWSSGTDAGGYNGPGATYLVQASTMPTFLPVAGSSLTAALSATVEGLSANATHHFRLRAYNAAGLTDFSWLALGSTVTAIEAPETVLFADVSTRGITAVAYARTPAFSSMTVGESGVAVALDGVYLGGPNERWRSRTALTTSRYGLAAAAAGGKLYAIGGHTGAGATGVVEEFDPVANVWAVKTPMPTARLRPGAAVVDGKIYVVGGEGAGTLAVNEEYDPVRDVWTARAPMPTPRDGLAAAAVGGIVYAVGGNGGLGVNEAYNPATDSWATRQTLPTGRNNLVAVALRGKVYTFGGLGGQSATEAYDPATNAWTVRAGMPTPRYLMAAAVVGEKAYVVGGTVGVLKANEEYDPVSNVWAARAEMPTARNDLAAAALGGRVYAVGGYAAVALGTVEEFEPATASSFTFLTPNTLYSFKAKARNSAKTETQETAVVSTYTLAAATVPQLGAGPIASVFASSLTVQWSSGTDAGGYNGPGATYLVEASTMATFAPTAGSSLTAANSAVVAGLSPDATHYLRVKALNAVGVPNDSFFLGSTVTLAFPAASAASTYTAVGSSSLTVAWDSNGNAPGTRYDVAFTTYFPFSAAVIVSTRPYGAPSATAVGLLANATYYPLVFAFNRAGVASAETPLGSTATHIETPSTVLIEGVSTHSVVAVASSPVGAFTNLDQSSSAVNIARDGLYQDWVAGSSVTFSSGLAPNTLYSFKAKARNVHAAETPESATVSTYTLAFATTAPAGTFPALFASSVSVQWASGTPTGGYNGPGATYLVEASTDPSYAPTAGSTTTFGASATVSGLAANATHYFRVRAFNSYGSPGGWVVLGATVTAVEAPSGVAFLSVSSQALVAVATAAGTGFSNLSVGTSAVNIALDGVYQGWVVGSSVTVSSGLVPNTLYSFRAKARNLHGAETSEAGPVSTHTLAAVPSTATPAFLGAFASSVSLQWTHNGNPGPTQYRLRASTSANLDGAGDALSDWFAGTSTDVVSLSGNTTFYFAVRARNGGGYETAEAALGSTVTAAAVPASAASTFSAVAASGLTLSWAPGGNGTGTLYEALLSTEPLPNGNGDNLTVSTRPSGTPAADFSGLAANATYYAAVRAVSHGGLPTAYALLGATATLANPPVSAASTFSAVGQTAFTASWGANGNAAGTRYTAVASTAAVLGLADPANVSVTTEPYGAPGATVSPLSSNATYFLFVAALSRSGAVGAFTPLGSTVTAPASPATAVTTFTAVASTSFSAAWSAGGNAAGTRYRVTTSTGFPLVLGLPGNVTLTTEPAASPSAAVSGLAANSTHYLFVSALGRTAAETGYTFLGATVTAMETPSGVYASSVGSTSLVAVASAPGGAFTNLAAGASAVDIALNGVFQGWVAGSSVTVSSGLVPNTLYLLRARARNQVRTETPESLNASTWTLAALPSTATPSFSAVSTGSLAVRWGSNGNPAGTEYLVEFSTASDWTGGADALVGWAAATESARTGLTPNTTFHVRVTARNGFGAETDWTPLGATATLAAVPGPAASTFTAVAQSSLTVTWALGANPAGTLFRALRSTSASFDGAGDGASGWLASPSTTFLGLAPDTTYYWRAVARNHAGLSSVPLELGAQATLAHEPAASTEPFHRVGASSAVVQWEANGNPPTTLYEAQLSTSPAFGGEVRSSDWTASLSTTVAGLTGDATYYLRARARGAAGVATPWAGFGSTATLAADPDTLAAASVGAASVLARWPSSGNREAESLGSWAVRAALPAALERHGSALLNGRLYAVGGVKDGAPTAEVWSAGVSPSGTLGAWRRESELPAARESLAVAAFAGRLYAVGGFEGSPKATVYAADAAPDGRLGAWRTENALPAARAKLAAVAHEGWLYAFGGDNGVVSQASVYRASIRDDGGLGTWAAATALPSGRNGHGAAVSGGRVYVAGGLGAGVEEEVWSAALSGPSVGAWRVETPLPVPVFRHSLLATGGSLLSVGGHDGTAAVSAVRAARLAADGTVGAWESLNALPLPRFGHGAALETGSVLVFGGADDGFTSADAYHAALGGTQYLLERAQDAGFTVDYASSNWRAGAGAELAGLTPNSPYFLRLRARSRAGVEGAILTTASTRTLAAVPGSAASTFSLVEAGSVTLAWADGGNPAGTEYVAGLSTSADLGNALISGWTTSLSSAVYGLTPNTTYYAGVLARDQAGRQSRELSLGTTVTAAAVPENPSFPSVVTTGLSVAWSTAGNPGDTRYEAQLSAAPSFSPLAASTVAVSSGAAFTDLLSATTYYLRVRALNRLGTPSAFTAATQAVTGADFTAPSPVANLGLHATQTPGVLRAAWTAPGDDGGVGTLPAGSKFYLQWAVGDPAAVAWSTAGAQLAPSTGPVAPGAGAGMLVTGLTAGASVYARVWAADESGNVSGLSAVAAAWASPFTLTRLDGTGQDAGRWASVALDRAGDAHAAYTAGTVAQELRYLKRAGGVWSVAEAPDPGTPAEEAVLAMGASSPQVVYRNSSTGQLRLAKRASGWSAAAVAGGDLHPGGLAVDATSFAHISYFDAGLPGLRYARWNGASWDLETVDAGAGRGRFSSLALDGASTPHIAYYDAAAGDLKHASRTAAGVWATSTVDGGVDAGSTPVVALDGAGRPLIAYVDYAAKDLKLATFDGAAWGLSAVDAARDVTGLRGFALDGAGRPVVTYYDGTDGDLVLGRWNGTGWETGAVDSYGDVGAWSGVAVEPDGGLLELHYDASQGDLTAGTWNAGLAVPLAGNPRGRAQAPAAFGGVVASSVGIQWTWTDSASAELGWRLYGGLTSTGPFAVVAGTSALPASAGTGTQRVYTENGLTEGTTYYRYVAAVSSGGVVVSPMAALFPYVTADLTAPSVTNNITGGDLVWRRAAGTLYNVDFTDTGGSALDRFQVKASTVSGGAGPDLVAFTDVATGILADTYTADWALPAAVFAALADGATNYITVRVVDGNSNAATQADVFKVLKDTTPPTFADAQADDPVRRGAGGTLYDVDAFDPASGLERFQYSVSTVALSADQGAVAWTDIPLAAGATGFQANWTLAFAGLLGDATNFVSVRAWDRAGSTAALTDAFFVVKDTGGPRVAVQQPAAAFRSVLTLLSGTAADAAGVGGVQVALQEGPPGGVWFDGAGFTSGTPVWLAASGTAAWTFGAVPAWADGSSYRVVARASDTLGNFSVAYATSDFSFDASTPAAAVTVPANGATLVSLPALSGTAAETGASPSGLALVEVRLQRASDASYWDWAAGSWTGTAASTSAPLASPWTVAVPAALRANLASGASYFVSARASDNAVPANVGSFAAASTFTWSDTTPPAAITGLSALTGAAPGEILLTWTAPGDDGPLDDIALGTYRIHYSTDPAAVFSTAAAQVEFSTAGLRPGLAQGCVVTGLSSGATYHLRVFLADDAGNWSGLSNGATAYARNQPFNKIVGHVMKSSSQGVTGVLLEAYDAAEVRVATATSLPVSSGAYSLNGLPDGVFRVLATWTAGEVTSSVWLDGIAMGTSDVDFMLEIQYTLSTLTGTLASLAAQTAAPAGFLVRAEEGGFSESRVDLLRGGMTVATVSPDPTGRWTIPNLLPGKYAVRAFNGLDYTDPQPVELGEGETQEVVFVFDPLPEASVFAFPNPARSHTTFRFVSALPGLEAQVTVFDIAGTLVKELPGSAFAARPGGVYHAVWDLTNDDGESVASGVYLFMVKVKGSNGQSGKVVKKLAVVR